MFRRAIACLILSMWAGLLGVEFCEELGLFVFANEQTDQAADDALAGLGQALPTANRPFIAIAKEWLNRLKIVQFFGATPAFEPLAFCYKYGLPGTVPKHHIAIYQLYLNLRI